MLSSYGKIHHQKKKMHHSKQENEMHRHHHLSLRGKGSTSMFNSLHILDYHLDCKEDALHKNGSTAQESQHPICFQRVRWYLKNPAGLAYVFLVTKLKFLGFKYKHWGRESFVVIPEHCEVLCSFEAKQTKSTAHFQIQDHHN